MRPNLIYFYAKFEQFNQQCFGGTLPRPMIRLNTNSRSVGLHRISYRRDAKGNRIAHHSLEFSVLRDLPEDEYIDTILHEMIHYYLALNGQEADSKCHGPLFRQKMQQLQEATGHHITIRYAPDLADSAQIKALRYKYFCIATMADGNTTIGVFAKTRLFEYWDLLPKVFPIRQIRWFASNRDIISTYPTCLKPKLYAIDAARLELCLTGAIEVENDGQTIRPKRR